MKLALLSDIHSNRQALDACMEHARVQGAQRFAECSARSVIRRW